TERRGVTVLVVAERVADLERAQVASRVGVVAVVPTAGDPPPSGPVLGGILAGVPDARVRALVAVHPFAARRAPPAAASGVRRLRGGIAALGAVAEAPVVAHRITRATPTLDRGVSGARAPIAGARHEDARHENERPYRARSSHVCARLYRAVRDVGNKQATPLSGADQQSSSGRGSLGHRRRELPSELPRQASSERDRERRAHHSTTKGVGSKVPVISSDGRAWWLPQDVTFASASMAQVPPSHAAIARTPDTASMKEGARPGTNPPAVPQHATVPAPKSAQV